RHLPPTSTLFPYTTLFRSQICRRYGADVVVSEFISSVGISLGIERVLAEMRFEPVERPIGIQIYGADAAIMAKAAGMVTELFEPDRKSTRLNSSHQIISYA